MNFQLLPWMAPFKKIFISAPSKEHAELEREEK
jgi:hypothetical protein